MKRQPEIVYLPRRPASERERLRIELDRTDTPPDALARRLIARSLAAEVAQEFRAARRRQ